MGGMRGAQDKSELKVLSVRNRGCKEAYKQLAPKIIGIKIIIYGFHPKEEKERR